MPKPDQTPEAPSATIRSLERLWLRARCGAADVGRLLALCNDESFVGGIAEDWNGVVGPVVVQRAVTSGVIAPVTRGRTSSLFSMTTVHSAPDLSRQFVSSRLRAPSMSLGLATQ
jgi:hypothetical protein